MPAGIVMVGCFNPSQVQFTLDMSIQEVAEIELFQSLTGSIHTALLRFANKNGITSFNPSQVQFTRGSIVYKRYLLGLFQSLTG